MYSLNYNSGDSSSDHNNKGILKNHSKGDSFGSGGSGFGQFWHSSQPSELMSYASVGTTGGDLMTSGFQRFEAAESMAGHI